MTRDPRACTLSALHFCRNKKRKLYEPSVEEVVSSEWDDDMQICGGWHRHASEWIRMLDSRTHSLVLGFEDVVANPGEAVRSLGDLLKVSLTADQADAVAARNNIDTRRGEASVGNQKYFRSGSIEVDGAWHTQIPEDARVRVRQLCKQRWKEHAMDELLDAHPFLRRYRPAAKRPGPIRRVVIAGLGFHCRRIYLPRLAKREVTLALVIDLEGQREGVQAALRAQGLAAEAFLWVPDEERGRGALTAGAAAALAGAGADGVVVSSDPLAHEPYLRWALEHGVDVIVDKPPLIPRLFSLSREGAARLRTDFEEVLRLAAGSEANAMVMSQRRAHPGYRFVRDYLAAFVREWRVPISYVDVYHADGMWCMPGEMCTRDYHPYKHGYGKLMFSGYHFVDLVTWLLAVNDTVRGEPLAGYRVRCARFDPRDALQQLPAERLRALLAPAEPQLQRSLAEVPAELGALGELNVHAVVQAEAASGAVEAVASLNLLHNSFSRRAWFEPRPDLYKGNGRVRHERLVVQVGPLLSLHVHSYQAGEPHDPAPDPAVDPATGPGAAANLKPGRSESPSTAELLRKHGLAAAAGGDDVAGGAAGAGEGYGVGHEEHFDVTIFRNSGVVGGVPVETIPIGKVMMRERGEEAAAREWLGHNEKARHLLLDEWLQRAPDGGLAPLRSQQATMDMLSRLYGELAAAARGGQ